MLSRPDGPLNFRDGTAARRECAGMNMMRALSWQLVSRELGYAGLLLVAIGCGGATDVAADDDATEASTSMGGAGPTNFQRGGNSNTGPAAGSATRGSYSGGATTRGYTTARGGSGATSAATLNETCDHLGQCTNEVMNCGMTLAPSCVPSCFEPDNYSVAAICEGTTWRCPTGSVARTACPEDSCAFGARRCCDSNTGVVSWATCNSTGYLDECPLGQVATMDACAPVGLHVDECGELDKKPCRTPSDHCDSGMAFCDCDADSATGQLAWSCQYYLID
ncbi:MAG: hypothetical protein QM784_10265 [Polyangiaceae bacterium]